jgi:integrase
VPLVEPVRTALLEALGHRDLSPWVTWGWRDQSEPVTYDGMQRALHRLEARAGVPRVPGRAFHAFRRALATELARRLGIPAAAAYLGDTPQVIATTYVRPGERDMAEAAAVAQLRMAGAG